MKVNPSAFQFGNFSKRQRQLLSWWLPGSPYSTFDGVIAQGAIRSGKTISILVSFLLWSLYLAEEQETELDFIIASKTMGALKRNLIKPLFKILNAFGIPYKYDRSSEAPALHIGRVNYYLFAGSNEASQDVLQGFTAAGALLDEVVLMPESFVDQAIGRCSVKGSKVWFTCNPGGPFHWFKVRFVDQAKAKRLCNLHFTLQDNPALSLAIRERYERMFTGSFYQRYILGLWVLAEGLVYSMFSRDRHMVPPSRVPDLFKRYAVVVDHGTTNPTVFGFFGYGGRPLGAAENRAYLLRLHYFKPDQSTGLFEKTDSQHGKDFDLFIDSCLPRGVRKSDIRVVVDPAATGFKAELRARGYAVENARNAVLEGIQALGAALLTDELLVQDLPEMKPLEEEFGTYAWDPKASERGEDEPIKRDDHVMDMLRYFIYTILKPEEMSFNPNAWKRATA